MQTCANCGAELAPDWKFCIRCGARVRTTDASEIPGAIRPEQPEAQPLNPLVIAGIVLGTLVVLAGVVAVAVLLLTNAG
ncbi:MULTISPECIES: zinc ribbon domain-containing protein [unclassified Diaminobutyricimonas]|uniref:zinc-ribbon domain-containing protein n=1 Tax=unclassified Diaminobutyricimonas TaxID=2643261 RepID=UPI0012F511BE|nr:MULTISPECIES: zinc ribbon domain-containing protein [unclassified Diaminobutyricimonas]